MINNKKLFFVTGTVDVTKNEGTGGVPKLIINLSKALAVRLDMDIKIISCFKGDEEPQFSIDKSVEHIHLQNRFQHSSNLPTSKKILFWMYSGILLIKALRKTSSYNNVLISCTPAITVMLLLTKLIHKNKVYVWENVSFDRYGKIINFFRRSLYKNADFYISPTLKESENLKACGFNSIRIANTNYSHPNEITPKEVGGNTIKLLAIGRLVYQKGFDMLMMSMLELDKKYPNWSLTLIGSGPEEKKIRKIAEEGGIINKIKFIAHSTNLEEYYEEADIFLLSSRYEGSPLVVVEAQSYGMPCISFDCPTGPGEIIKHGSNGLLVQLGDFIKFSEYISYLVNQPDIYMSMSAASRRRSMDYTESNTTNQWIGILQ